MRGVALALIAIGGCGGTSTTQATGPRPEPTSAVVASAVAEPERHSLSELLLPVGSHRSAEQLAEIAAFIRRWEQDPYAPVPENDTDLPTAALMLRWLTESPDIRAVVCVAPSVLEGDGPDVGAATVPGYVFGLAAYYIEHPGQLAESDEVQVAGIESALRWYAAARLRGGAHNAHVDALVERHAHGGTAALMAWYVEQGIRCAEQRPADFDGTARPARLDDGLRVSAEAFAVDPAPTRSPWRAARPR